MMRERQKAPYRYIQTTEDTNCQSNLCLKKENELEEITLKELKMHTVATDRILWVKTIEKSC